jgi:DNA-directed RNA polymerase specialized sigma24 family protein
MAVTSERDAQAFYAAWKDYVFTFCSMFVGDSDRAEEITAEAFYKYLQQRGTLDLEYLPPRLMGLAFQSAKRERALSPDYRMETDLEDNLLYLPVSERAVFIMRALEMSDAAISIAIGLTVEQVRGLWVSALLNLRTILPKEFFNSRRRL